jgi:two-component system cell cycle sensor histidine kinase/response regulator CckA
MKSPLHILHLEDNSNDAALVQSTLEADGISCQPTCVRSHDAFVAALEHGGIDLVLSDSSIPGFDGLSAIALVRNRWPDLPVILVSGTMGEEKAVDSLKHGATDCVLKGSLSRLAPAVRRAMREVEGRADRRRREEQFIETRQMEVIGQLAGGVAHDFNNILAVIVGYSSMIASGLGPNSPLLKFTDEIWHASERASGLTRQLLVLSRNQSVQPVVLDLNKVVQDMEGMLRRLIDENIEMTIAVERTIGRIKADSGYVGQVLMNLVVNARDAMPNGGRLFIATRNVTLDASHARIESRESTDNHVMLSVADTGTGITDEVKARMFEAFFTTKTNGKSTGLGLSICLNIVQQCEGYIHIDTTVGRGTTFEVYFPRVELPLHSAAKGDPSGPLPRGTEVLLVVEDEPSIRYLACAVLEGQGYKVLSAANGQDALHLAHAHGGSPLRLVVTDVMMPLMGGDVMADYLKATFPDLKILFTSGYADDSIMQRGVLDAGVEFLAKPYTSATLVYKVREMLDGR